MAYSTAWGRINGGESKMNQRQQRKRVEIVLRENIIACPVWQEKPYTAVRLTAEYNGKMYQHYGFTKVQYPDKWNADWGVELAMDKAFAKISKEIVNDDQSI